jgi:hypothetical protein
MFNLQAQIAASIRIFGKLSVNEFFVTIAAFHATRFMRNLKPDPGMPKRPAAAIAGHTPAIYYLGFRCLYDHGFSRLV